MRRRAICVLLVLVAACDKPSSGEPSTPDPPVASTLALPGAEPFPADLAKKLESVRGDAEHVNRLALETSPYLRQHANNPVNWFPWGDEAFAEARRLNRPVLLSVGYSTCHWCHVMEEESFEDPEIARFLNAHYVAIKVDREERPDVDAYYMAAVMRLTGQGGWPMTVWLTPDREPFFGGTYFAPRAGVRGPGKGFMEYLKEWSEQWRASPQAAQAYGSQVAEKLREELEQDRSGTLTDLARPAELAYVALERAFDSTHGGWGRQKFPLPSQLRFLLRHHRRTGEERALEMARQTLDAMLRGGIYDQLGGGFHRYTIDPAWRVPHFEKMLYDNAQLVAAYTEAWQATQDPEFARVVEETVSYLLREMRSPDGGFYAATDADSEGGEGAFYTWTPDDLSAALTADENKLAQLYFGVTDRGELEGRSALRLAVTKDEALTKLGLTTEELEQRLKSTRDKLLAARQKRPAPARDEKVITAWNGLALDALARAAFAFDREDWEQAAVELASHLMEQHRIDGRLVRSRFGSSTTTPAFAEDYAFVIGGLISLFETTADPQWLRAALELQQVFDQHHRAPNGPYTAAPADARDVLAVQTPFTDGAIPSANAVAVMNLLRLHTLTLKPDYETAAQKTLRAFGGNLANDPGASPYALFALHWLNDGAREVGIVLGAKPEPLLEVLRRGFQPDIVMVRAAEGDERVEALVPWMREKTAIADKTTAYVCRKRVCKLPTNEPPVLHVQLTASEPVPGVHGDPD